MTKENTQKPKQKTSQSREDRLKEALKANLGRRKAQVRARHALDEPATNGQNAKTKE